MEPLSKARKKSVAAAAAQGRQGPRQKARFFVRGGCLLLVFSKRCV
jgi:hypothetical protein